MKSACWQIVGYPEWFSERGSRGGHGPNRGSGRVGAFGDRGRGQVNVVYTTSPTPNAAVPLELTPEQWKAISQILNESLRQAFC